MFFAFLFGCKQGVGLTVWEKKRILFFPLHLNITAVTCLLRTTDYYGLVMTFVLLFICFQADRTGFSIAAAKKRATSSLIIGPGSGYNLVC